MVAYVLSFITTIGTGFFSDRYKTRAFPLMFWWVTGMSRAYSRSAIACVGYIILLTVPISQPGVLYFAVFLTTAAVGPLIATTIAWTGNTWGNHCEIVFTTWLMV